ncbi:iron donor protein CyaY [Mergibacter septicus]|uniref:Iron-sulfur cluster assembly protein CyaY n=1 Tax=Mergibacter septicus TaxID=221402 RepID=A0A8D4IUZ0_9PAST|nr:iron donor protein CyaY [Mergibacter septicus]AWX14011.1 iron donor protein CyaY [Mergibacter septicus]AWX14841.1 iron donor protein CyaY [Mergibacter septicus]QDJ13483.1 iron donor protein CyaY [Mergibacter septicus]QDJ14093.1 iron donor protein CyaY [Mergibacter septicus]UTU48457.1 iron donor protein CyaY [Mergibacter septicus]
MNVTEFHQQVETVWQHIENELDRQDSDIDCEINGAVMTLTFADDSQIVINKQEPLLELWLASRLGGLHFKIINGEWINTSGQTFWQALEQACTAHGECICFG